MTTKQNITVVLVGKTGHGKSSTGNTILQKSAFEETCYVIGGSELLELKHGFIGDYTSIKVFDTPGIMSLRSAEQRQKGSIRGEMDRLMDSAEEINIFILVFKFNGRFTPEEKETVQDLKKFFGPKFLKQYGMIVVTHGDNCESEAKKRGITSDEMLKLWYANAGNDFKELIQEVGENILLVNNSGDFNASSMRMQCSQDLRDKIVTLCNNGLKYTRDDYDKQKATCVIS